MANDQDAEAEGDAVLPNAEGLHARPAVKLTQLAKTLPAKVEIAVAAHGPWLDARSPAKVMRARAPKGARLYVRASGPEARASLEAVLALVRDGFGET